MSNSLFEFRMRYPGFAVGKVVQHCDGDLLECMSAPFERDGVIMVTAKAPASRKRFEKEAIDDYRISGKNPELYSFSSGRDKKLVATMVKKASKKTS